jgi:hypothetical protein
MLHGRTSLHPSTDGTPAQQHMSDPKKCFPRMQLGCIRYTRRVQHQGHLYLVELQLHMFAPTVTQTLKQLFYQLAIKDEGRNRGVTTLLHMFPLRQDQHR